MGVEALFPCADCVVPCAACAVPATEVDIVVAVGAGVLTQDQAEVDEVADELVEEELDVDEDEDAEAD